MASNKPKGVPTLPDVNTLAAFGFNSKGEYVGPSACDIKSGLIKGLRILDEQNAINRYTWYNLPGDLTGQFIETILYYKGQGCFFYIAETDEFLFLPYVLNGTIDVYGRYTGISPLPFTGKAENDKEVYIPGLILTPQYKLVMDENLTDEILTNSAVILYDYSKQYSQTIIPRKDIQEPIINMMSDCLPMGRTSLIANSGVKGIKVDDPDQGWIVKSASDSVYNAAINGSPWVPICSEIKMEDLTSAGSALNSEEYLLMMQGIDNYRLSLYGLKNGGLFQKKAHMLEAEAEMNDGNVGIIYQDGLTLRQRFCDIVNSIWNLGIWVEPSECITGVDRNGNMIAADEQDQSGTTQGNAPAEYMEGGEEDV